MKSRHKNISSHFKQIILFPLISIFCGIIATLAGLEIMLCFLPVNEGLRFAALNDKQPFLHFEPNRTSTWSRGWNFSLVNKVHSNNYGFINDQNYDPKGSGPLLALIGDSIVEAVMVPYPKTSQGKLAKSVNGFGRVYSFGISGAGLSDYLILAEYANKTFKPNGVIFIIISSDFEESIHKEVGHYYFFEEPNNNELVLKKVDYNPGFFRRVLRNSKLLMYLVTNVNVFERVNQRFRHRQSYMSNIERTVDEKVISDSKIAVDTFFKELPKRSGLDTSKILFVIDGIREVIYNPEKISEARGCYFDIMRRYFVTKAMLLGYEVIDMQKFFEEHYKIHRQRFEYPNDNHWNEIGHEVLADAVSRSSVFRKLFK